MSETFITVQVVHFVEKLLKIQDCIKNLQVTSTNGFQQNEKKALAKEGNVRKQEKNHTIPQNVTVYFMS